VKESRDVAKKPGHFQWVITDADTRSGATEEQKMTPRAVAALFKADLRRGTNLDHEAVSRVLTKYNEVLTKYQEVMGYDGDKEDLEEDPGRHFLWTPRPAFSWDTVDTAKTLKQTPRPLAGQRSSGGYEIFTPRALATPAEEDSASTCDGSSDTDEEARAGYPLKETLTLDSLPTMGTGTLDSLPAMESLEAEEGEDAGATLSGKDSDEEVVAPNPSLR
jgi:hypothetical protein